MIQRHESCVRKQNNKIDKITPLCRYFGMRLSGKESGNRKGQRAADGFREGVKFSVSMGKILL